MPHPITYEAVELYKEAIITRFSVGAFMEAR